MLDISLKLDRRVAGVLTFQYTDESQGFGFVKKVVYPENSAILKRIRELLRGNKLGLRIVGGYAPDAIASYIEGVVSTLDAVRTEEPRFDFVDPNIDANKFLPNGAIG